MQDLQELEKIEVQINILALDNDETIPLEATKTIKKKKVLSERQLEILSNARAKLAERNKERIAQKKLEQQAIEDEVQCPLNEYNQVLRIRLLKKLYPLKRNKLKRKHYLKRFQTMRPRWKK